MEEVLVDDALKLVLADLTGVESELREAPLTTSVVHNSRQHVKVAFRVF